MERALVAAERSEAASFNGKPKAPVSFSVCYAVAFGLPLTELLIAATHRVIKTGCRRLSQECF